MHISLPSEQAFGTVRHTRRHRHGAHAGAPAYSKHGLQQACLRGWLDGLPVPTVALAHPTPPRVPPLVTKPMLPSALLACPAAASVCSCGPTPPALWCCSQALWRCACWPCCGSWERAESGKGSAGSEALPAAPVQVTTSTHVVASQLAAPLQPASPRCMLSHLLSVFPAARFTITFASLIT